MSPSSADLSCYVFPDLFSWEKEAIQPLLDPLSQRCALERVDVSERHRDSLRQSKAGHRAWILSRNWQEALRYLGAHHTKSIVYVSVLGQPKTRRALPHLFWKRFHRNPPNSVRLMAHSPLNFRFLREMEAYPESHVSLLHLPFPQRLAQWFQKSSESRTEGLRVGTFARFSSENNLNFFLNVAHYISQKRTNVRFRIFGSGELYSHLADMVVDLNLSDQVTIVESLMPHEIEALDLMLFTPLRNDHFLPLLISAAARVPVLCSEIPGVEAYVEHGKSGYIFPVNETEPMGEMALELLQKASKRRALSEELYQTTSEKYSGERLAEQYWKVFFEPPMPTLQAVPEAA